MSGEDDKKRIGPPYAEQLLECVGDGIGDDAGEDDQREQHEGMAVLEHT
jgi:hypothetical protein